MTVHDHDGAGGRATDPEAALPADLTADIGAGPKGPEVGAFFDFDGTLIAGYSVRAFFEDRLRRLAISPRDVARLAVGIDTGVRGSGDIMSRLIEVAAHASVGQAEEDLVSLGERLFVRRIAGLAYPEARGLIRAHQRAGHTVALASSATIYQVGPYAADLGIDHVLCTRLEVGPDGRLTGRVDGPVLWGANKAVAVRDFAGSAGIDLTQSYGYANGDEDVAFLESVGRARALNPGRRLEGVAKERGWPVRRFRRRDGLDAVALARTGVAVAGLSTAAALGVGAGILNRSRRVAANVATSVGADLTLALAGVQLRVVGEEHLWSARPAVFMFNHQSSLDVLVVGGLLRRDVTGVAKIEASHDPRFAVFGWLANVAYVDRSDHAQAVHSLEGALERIGDGVSIAIAPEGTRSPTPRLKPFRKGAFHLAIGAGVPVVPVVIRNTGELMWRGSVLVRPGVVDVAVLPPVDTSGWRVETILDHMADVRARFEATLEDWPGPAGA